MRGTQGNGWCYNVLTLILHLLHLDSFADKKVACVFIVSFLAALAARSIFTKSLDFCDEVVLMKRCVVKLY
ncbi:hypothetical protein ACET3Z_009413 [Daucus carota]